MTSPMLGRLEGSSYAISGLQRLQTLRRGSHVLRIYLSWARPLSSIWSWRRKKEPSDRFVRTSCARIGTARWVLGHSNCATGVLGRAEPGT